MSEDTTKIAEDTTKIAEPAEEAVESTPVTIQFPGYNPP